MTAAETSLGIRNIGFEMAEMLSVPSIPVTFSPQLSLSESIMLPRLNTVKCIEQSTSRFGGHVVIRILLSRGLVARSIDELLLSHHHMVRSISVH